MYACVCAVGQLYGLAEHCRNFPCDSQYALAVGAVGCYAYIEDIVVQSQYGLNALAVFSRGWEKEETVVVGSLEHVAAHAQLDARTEHAVGLYAAQLALLDGHHALNGNVVLCRCIDGCAYQRHGRFYARLYVVRAAAYLQHAVFAAVNFAHVQVSSLYRQAFRNFADDDSGDVFAYLYKFFHFKTAAEQLFLQLLGRNVYINIIFQPA